ncbi:MAG: phenylacetate-CoA ligase [Firmicutes bacterium]|nr:phenylacetate-CoA ligase [Bacillota bacterium]
MSDKLAITPLDAWTTKKIGVKTLTADKLAAYQLSCLQTTIARVQQLSPFYRQQLAGYRQIDCLESLSRYPFTTPEQLAKQAGVMMCGSQSQISRVVTLATSGTTGNPKRIYFSKADQELTIEFFATGMSTLAGTGDKTLILLPGQRPGSVGDLLWQGLQRIAAIPTLYGLVDDTAVAVQTMCREEAVCLVGVPVQLLAMAKYWESWGQSAWTPRRVLVSTDYLSQAVISELSRIWHCEIFDHYGMTEMGLGGGLECAAHAGYHLREADLYFEIIDPVSGKTLPDGEYGEVVFTTLTRQGMPLVRYRTGDISRFITEPCPCGSILKRLERIQRRKDGLLTITPAGQLTMADFDEVLLGLPGVTNFSVTVIKNKPIAIKLIVEVVPGQSPTDKSQIYQAVRQLPAIREAERQGGLVVFGEFTHKLTSAPGKRSIQVTVGAEEDAENVR